MSTRLQGVPHDPPKAHRLGAAPIARPLARRHPLRTAGEQLMFALAPNRFNRFSSALPGWLGGALLASTNVLRSLSERACTTGVHVEARLSQPELNSV
jgi:hypothetical protein